MELMQPDFVSQQKLKNPEKFHKLVNKNSPKKLTAKAALTLQKLVLLYMKDGIKRVVDNADEQAKDYIDWECFAAIEEKLRVDYG